MDNVFYDESLHEDCIEVMRLMIKLHVEFCTRNPNPDISGHMLREAERISDAVQSDELDIYEVIELYATIVQDLEELGNVSSFLKLPLIFMVRETNDKPKEE
tara:strand:- start:57269 stop:57574 length:306 start_codon:yes stop_codon:yes gene_type:complete